MESDWQRSRHLIGRWGKCLPSYSPHPLVKKELEMRAQILKEKQKLNLELTVATWLGCVALGFGLVALAVTIAAGV